jgi:hypothetical protein
MQRHREQALGTVSQSRRLPAAGDMTLYNVMRPTVDDRSTDPTRPADTEPRCMRACAQLIKQP